MSTVDQIISPAEAKWIGDRVGVSFRRFSLEEYRSLLEASASTRPNTDEEWLRLGKMGKTQLEQQSPDLQLGTMRWYSGLSPCPRDGFQNMALVILRYLAIIFVIWLVVKSFDF